MAKSSKSASRDIKHRITIPERYTDEPADVAGSSSSAIPLLAHPDDYDQDTHDPDEELPGYNDYEGSDNDSPPGFTTYRPVVQKIKTINDILTVSLDPHLNSDGEALYRWLAEESLIPPKPEVRIRGTHMIRRRNGDKTETSTTTDFDIRLKLGEYFLEGNVPGYAPYLTTVDGNRRANRGGRWKTVAADPEEVLPVRCWADRYCEDKSILKEFVMKKICVGWDLTLLENELEAIIRSTNYLGRIEINFPVLEARVEVFPANRISRIRKNVYWRWFFYLTFGWIFTWPLLWFFTRRYHVVETYWRYSTRSADYNPDGRAQRVAVHEEEEWLMAWGPAIKRAAKARRHGFVTAHDIDEMDRAELEGQTGAVRPPPKTGNSTIDGALGFIAGVGSIANDIRLSRSEIIGWGGNQDL